MKWSPGLALCVFGTLLRVASGQTDDAHQQHKELIHAIKQDLKRVDRVLLEIEGAQNGPATSRQPKPDIDRTLSDALSRQRRVIENIEELIRQRSHMPGGG